MIKTDGKRTIANAEPRKKRLTFEEREAALTRGLGVAPGETKRIELHEPGEMSRMDFVSDEND